MTSGKGRTRHAQRLADQATLDHRRGALDQAEAGFRAALLVDPELPDALHGLGLLALGRGLPAQAIALIGRASARRPNHALYTLNLGHALRARGHVEEARAALHVACLQDPGDPRAHAGLAVVLEQLGRRSEAAQAARTALDLAAGTAHATGMAALIGRVALADGNRLQAVAALSEAVALDDADAGSWHGLAVAHAALGQHQAAEQCFRRVAELRPDDPAALANLAARLFERNRLDEALLLLRRATVLAPPTAETRSNLGLVLLALGHLREAEQTLALAAGSGPEQAGIAVNHGTALLELNRHEEAEQCFLAVEQRARGSLDADRARFNRATLLLGSGRFRAGWEAFEARHPVLGRGPSTLPPWDGSALPADAMLLVEAEQGLGDVIQFLRYVPAAMRLARLVLALPQTLVRLARRSLPPECIVLAAGEPVPDCAARVDLLSLPLLLGLDQPFWPGAYLRADPVPADGTIGLCWAGSPGYRFDRRRSLSLAQLAPLAAPSRRFVALQPDRTAESPVTGMALARPVLGDLADTAGVIAALDLVITVDTAVAHLAGALGRPVWLMNRFGGDWRWHGGNRDADGGSLWYPGLSLFQQTQPLPPDVAWTGVIDQVAEALDGRF